MISLKRSASFVLLLLLWLPVAALGQDDENPVVWSLKGPATAKPLKLGEKFVARLSARISEGWHLYSISQPPGGPNATVIMVPAGAFELAGPFQAPKPMVAADPNFNMNTEFYEGGVTFGLPLKVSARAAGGKQVLKVSVEFQACNDRTCIPPTQEELKAEIALASGAVGEASPPAAPPVGQTPPPVAAAMGQPAAGVGQASTPVASAPSSPPANSGPVASAETASPASSLSSPEIRNARGPHDAQFASGGGSPQSAIRNPSQSLGSFLWLAMVMGALSLLTPCVFPMVPITVSYFSNHAAGSRKAAVSQAGVYAGGIILTFAALGMFLALVFGAGGVNRLAADPWVNLLITAIFIGFALNLFGAYLIQIPPSLVARFNAITSRSGGGSQVAGTLAMGFTFTLTSFTCTAPFVGTLLVMASQGNWRWPLAGMIAFSTVFALPFFVLALAPQLLSMLPKSGGWMNSTKVVMGFLEVAAAMKFISNVDLVWQWGIFTREVVIASWVATGIMTVFYLLGWFRLSHDSEVKSIGAFRLSTALVFLSITFCLLPGLFGRRLGEIESFLPPATVNAASADKPGQDPNELSWVVNDYRGALEQARSQNKLLFIDFTGYTCTNCRWMESNMFPRPEVRKELQKYLRVRLYTDGRGEQFRAHQKLQQERYRTVALPYYVVMDATEKTLATFPGLTRNPDEFLAFLKRGQ